MCTVAHPPESARKRCRNPSDAIARRGTEVAESRCMQTDSTRSALIRERFLSDHRRLEQLLERLMNAFEANDREDIQRLWTDLESSLLVHIDAEEKFLLPSLLRTHESEAHGLLRDHERIRTRLTELGAGIDLHIVRLETARALAEELRSHARDEDGIYQWADIALGEPERTSLLSAITERVRVAARSRSK
jgi:hypothetical protein